MAGCEAILSGRSGKQGRPIVLRPCGMKAVVKVPEGMDLKAGKWLCAQHAPAKLLAGAHGIGGKGGADHG